METLVKSLITISFEIVNDILATSKKSFVISPYSIVNIVGMLLNGSDAETKYKLKDLLSYTGNTSLFNINLQKVNNLLQKTSDYSTDHCILKNFVFYRKEMTVLESFEKSMEKYFQSKCKSVDLNKKDETIKIINNCVKDNTNGIIPKIVNDISDRFQAMLLNTLFFQGSWFHPFKKVEVGDFYDVNKTFKVQMMKQKKKKRAIETNLYKAVQIDYINSSFSFVAVLPKENDSLLEVNKFIMENGGLTNLLLEMKEYTVHLDIPKFTIKTDIDLYDDIESKKLQDVIKNSFFDRIFDGFQLKRPDLKHVAVIDVNEQGTLAAAATTATFVGCCLSKPDVMKIELNRPFLYYIVKTFTEEDDFTETECLPIFMGTYMGNDN